MQNLPGKNFFVISLFLSAAVSSFSTFAEPNDWIVSMKNVTNCHVNSQGQYSIGKFTWIGTMTRDFQPYSTIDPNAWGNVPVINQNNHLSIIVNNDDASDSWDLNYIPGENFILSYDGPTDGCSFPLHQCVVLSSFNPCDSPRPHPKT